MPTEFQDTLIALHDRYLALVPTTVQQAHHTREQLNHINALLVEQTLAPGASASAMPSETTKPFSFAVSQGIAPPAQPLAAQPAFPALTSAPALTATPTPPTPATKAQPKPAASQRKPKATPPPKPPTKPAEEQGKAQRDTVLSLLPSFAGLSKTEAVAKVMADHAGQPLSLDQIIEQLHGELDASALRQERKRMRTIMWRGVDSKRWARAKGKDSHYTLSGKGLPTSNGKTPTKSRSTATKTTMASKAVRGKGAIAKPAIAGSLMGAVGQVLQDNRGTPMRAEAIATAIYGKLSPARLAEVKKDIADRLAKGAKANRWQRVPEGLGVYVYR